MGYIYIDLNGLYIYIDYINKEYYNCKSHIQRHVHTRLAHSHPVCLGE